MDSPVIIPMSNFLDLANQLSWTISVREHGDFFSARSHSRLILQGSRAVKESAIIEFLRDHIDHHIWSNQNPRREFIQRFVDRMPRWLKNHGTNHITGLERFQIDFSAGTTQSFDSFYWRHRHRRMRCLMGEYLYHIKHWIGTSCQWDFVTPSQPLETNDALVLSVPFCDTGNALENYQSIMEQCCKLHIPVLIDACYYPISTGIVLDLDHDCIDTVTFSLSKCFPVGDLRIGVRFTRPGVSDGQKLYNDIGYVNTFSAYVGDLLIQEFSSDYIYNTYRGRQATVCRALDLTMSSTVLFGIGDKNWNLYSRKNLLDVYGLDLDPTMFKNRISLTGIFDNWDIFQGIRQCILD
jgi:hypothetical protein